MALPTLASYMSVAKKAIVLLPNTKSSQSKVRVMGWKSTQQESDMLSIKDSSTGIERSNDNTEKL